MAGQIAATSAEVEIPRLEQGDHLTRDEFERRYHAMPNVKKAELIEGVVYMPSPVRFAKHARPHSWMVTWLGIYEAATQGTESGDNPTLRLDLENEPQPDAILRIKPEYGGRSKSQDDYIVGAPELVVEIAASSVSYDLHEKKRAYCRNGVQEYLVWLVDDARIEWWELSSGRYVSLATPSDPTLKSQVFPGLWLDAQALLDGDLAQFHETLRAGTQTDEHRQFVERLAQQAADNA